MQSTDPASSRHYELVDEMQKYHGQELNLGAVLDASFAGTYAVPVSKVPCLIRQDTSLATRWPIQFARNRQFTQ